MRISMQPAWQEQSVVNAIATFATYMSLSMSALDQVAQASQNYPKAQGFTPSYGTAGFRAAADLLPPTVFRQVQCIDAEQWQSRP